MQYACHHDNTAPSFRTNNIQRGQSSETPFQKSKGTFYCHTCGTVAKVVVHLFSRQHACVFERGHHLLSQRICSIPHKEASIGKHFIGMLCCSLAQWGVAVHAGIMYGARPSDVHIRESHLVIAHCLENYGIVAFTINVVGWILVWTSNPDMTAIYGANDIVHSLLLLKASNDCVSILPSGPSDECRLKVLIDDIYNLANAVEDCGV